jgi:hypothetical protein
MKKNLLLLLLFSFIIFKGFSQSPGNYFSGTIKPGSQGNSVYIVVKSNTTLTGVKLSSFQFELGIPTTVSPRPTESITSFDPTVTYAKDSAVETQDATTYYGYGFSGIGTTLGTAQTFTAGIEDTLAEVFFNGNASSTTSQVRMMQLPNGGSTLNVNFYIADRGNDVTNQPAQFYGGSMFSNDGNGYTGSSYVLISNIALPVKLSSFTASTKNNSAFLSWTVENQDANSSHFEIERSMNGTDFKNVATIQVSSTSQGNYSYGDNASNLFGDVYYRLKMVDKNGTFVYSDIKSVQFKNAAFAVSLYPNPVHSAAKINVTLDQSQIIKVLVTDAVGKSVQQFEISGQKGLNQKMLDLSNVPSGSYMLTILAGGNSKTLSVIKN